MLQFSFYVIIIQIDVQNTSCINMILFSTYFSLSLFLFLFHPVFALDFRRFRRRRPWDFQWFCRLLVCICTILNVWLFEKCRCVESSYWFKVCWLRSLIEFLHNLSLSSQTSPPPVPHFSITQSPNLPISSSPPFLPPFSTSIVVWTRKRFLNKRNGTVDRKQDNLKQKFSA